MAAHLRKIIMERIFIRGICTDKGDKSRSMNTEGKEKWINSRF